MMRILVCDDEGIVRESVRFIIETGLDADYELEFAKNGRSAVSLAEAFRPDIILMDIQMPGMNGLDAMWQIRSENKDVLFIVLTAYDKFEYTQRAISIGVMEYLTKPIRKELLLEILTKAVKVVHSKKEKLRKDLEIKEKLEVVVPMIENGFVYNILMNESGDGSLQIYRDLLGVEQPYGYVLMIACGDELRRGILANAVGAGIRLQKHDVIFRETIKKATGGFPGALMENKVIVVVPSEKEEESYENRLIKIENLRMILRRLEQQFDMKFKAGIGNVGNWERMSESYREAMDALRRGVGKVNHVKDLQNICEYGDAYLLELQKSLFAAIQSGEGNKTRELGCQFLEAIKKNAQDLDDSVRLKIIEVILGAEYYTRLNGKQQQSMESQSGYLERILKIQDYEELSYWFMGKITEACRCMEETHQEKGDGVIDKAKEYIKHNFAKSMSLEELARKLEISPYYFSKLFKEKEGVNYIDYVTGLRIEYAKKQLKNKEKSIKMICVESGYKDPNYFSRIFKKWTGVTPSEYREEII